MQPDPFDRPTRDAGVALHDPVLLAFIRDMQIPERQREDCKAELCRRKIVESWMFVEARNA